MSSSAYSAFIQTKIAVYTTAITNAYNNRNADNALSAAWTAMNASSDLTSPNILPTGSNAFWKGAEGNVATTAGNSEIEKFEKWLTDNPTHAASLNVRGPLSNTDASTRKDLGAGGLVQGERRKWKGSPQYTFGNGVLIGKDTKVVAAIGTDGKGPAGDIAGFGDDTLIYFDGVHGSKGTNLAGTSVFGGDVVVSGSIQGDAGVVIIDDVIQLEQNVDNPAAIGVDPNGIIRLRHRGEGFLDLIEEDELRQIETRRWTASQNTSSARYGSSLIPNSEFSIVETSSTGTYTQQIANIATVGQTSTLLSVTNDASTGVPEVGIARLLGTGNAALVFQSIPITSEQYSIRIRFKGEQADSLSDDGQAEGLFLEFHETTTEDINTNNVDKFYIYDSSAPPGVSLETSKNTQIFGTNASGDVPAESNTITRTAPLLSTSQDGGDPAATDGVTISSDFTVKTFKYVRSSSDVKNASLVIYLRDYQGAYVDIDYIVMTELPPTNADITQIAQTAADDFLTEAENEILDSKMSNKSNWAALGTGSNTVLTDTTDGESNGDNAIKIQISNIDSAVHGILSSQTSALSDRYTIGVKVKALGDTSTTVKLFAVEQPSENYSTFDAHNVAPLTSLLSSNRVNVSTIRIDENGSPQAGGSLGDTANGAGTTQTVADNNAGNDGDGIPIEGDWVYIIGTYTATKKFYDSSGSEINFGSTSTMSDLSETRLPSTFCVGLEATSNCQLLVDYFYCKQQGSSVDIATELSNQAYVDAEGFVTAINEFLIKEQGSLIYNANMSALGTGGKPAGYRSPNTLALATDNDDRQITVSDSSGTRYLISPPFQLGSADKFAVGATIKGSTQGQTITMSVGYILQNGGDGTGQLYYDDSGGGTNYVTIGDGTTTAFNSVSGVYNETANPSSGLGVGVDSLSITPNTTNDSDYVSMLGTWQRNPIDTVTNQLQNTGAYASKVASIIISSANDFTVDYILVKEQVCSFDLADATAELRRDEAVAQTSGYLEGVGQNFTQETGSMIANPGFGAWELNAEDKQKPQGWYETRGASNPLRVIPSFESTITAQQNKETVVSGLNARGSALRLTPGTGGGTEIGGVLSTAIQLPTFTTWTNPQTSATTEVTGTYSISARIRLGSAEPVGVRIRAHEYFDHITSSQTHVIGTGGSLGVTATSSYTGTKAGANHGGTAATVIEYDSTNNAVGTIQAISVINFSNARDTVPGYDPDYNADYTSNYEDAGDDQYVEYIPVDTNEVDGDKDSNASNYANWYMIGGTYTPSDGATNVSFEILFDADPNNDNEVPYVYVDYVNLISQPFDADLAQTIAEGRIEGLVGVAPDGQVVDGSLVGSLTNTLGTIEENLGTESETLAPNGNFQTTFRSGAYDYAKYWMPTGSSLVEGTKLRVYNQQLGSIGTYVEFDNSATSNISGIISKVLQNPYGIARTITAAGDEAVGRFDIGLRVKGLRLPQGTTSVAPQQLARSVKGTATGHTGNSIHQMFDFTNYSDGITINQSSYSTTAAYKDPLTIALGNTSYGGNKAWELAGQGSSTAKFYEYPFPVDTVGSNELTIAGIVYGFTKAWTDGSNRGRIYYQLRNTAGTGDITNTRFRWKHGFSEDGGATWTFPESNFLDGRTYMQLPNDTVLSGNPVLTDPVDPLFLVCALIADDGTSNQTSLMDLQIGSIRVYHTRNTSDLGNSERYFFTGGAAWFGYGRMATGSKEPDFSVQIKAHEYFGSITDANTIVASGSTIATPDASTGVSIQTFANNNTAGTIQNLNLIDMRYSGSSPATEVIIDADVVDDDAGESITDWRYVVGSYIPNESATAVSFEIVIDHDPSGDNDGYLQTVWLDSMTITQSTMTEDLAESIADARVFSELGFAGGETPISPLNVIRNADFREAIRVASSFAYNGSDDLKRPANWHYFGAEISSWNWSDTKFRFSPNSTTTNRGVRFYVGATTSQRYGIASAPFRITSSKYKLRVRIKSVDLTDTTDLFFYALTTKDTLSDAATVIANASSFDNAGRGYYYPDDTSYHVETSGAGISFQLQDLGSQSVAYNGLDSVFEKEWTPVISTNSSRPTGANLPEYASVVVYRKGVAGGGSLDVFEVSLEPIGQAYGSWQGNASSRYVDGATYSTDGSHILPDVPREIESKDPQLNSIDIKVTDTTSSTTVENALLLALPRNYYNANDGSTKQGTSFYYPGVGDLKYIQGEQVTNNAAQLILSLLGLGALFSDHPYRTLEFPSDSDLVTRITNINNIHFRGAANTTGDYEYYGSGYHPAQGSGDRSITGVGAIIMHHDYRNRGYGSTQNAPYGGTIQNCSSLYISAGSNETHRWNSYPITYDYANADTNEKLARSSLNPLANLNRRSGIYIMQRYSGGGITFINMQGTEHSANTTTDTSKPQRYGRWSIGMGYVDRFGFYFNGGSTWTADTDENFYSDDGYGSFPTDTNNSYHGTRHGYIDTDQGASVGAGAAPHTDSGLDLNHFTGQHRSMSESVTIEEHVGLIVVATGKYNTRRIPNNQKQINVNNAHPLVELATKRNQKSCFGVVSSFEDTDNDGSISFKFGNWVSCHPITEEDEQRLIINSLGEGAVWVCSINGNFENGDYITTCEIPGYGMLQDDDLLHNYTVAKITQDCNFELDNPYYDCVEFEFEGQTYRKAFVGCTYHCG